MLLPNEPCDLEFARATLRSRLETLLRELSALQRRLTEDGIHDTRVQSRRMRAALEAFEDLFPPHPYQAAYGMMRHITRTLGKAREQGVTLALLKDLTPGGDMAESLCREYLEERFAKKLVKRRKAVRKGLKRIGIQDLRSRVEFLLSGMEPSQDCNPPCSGRRRTRGVHGMPYQGILFAAREDARLRARQVIARLAQPILGFDARRAFPRASDSRLHALRIAAKKLRYAMEIFDPVWPGGLQECIAQAKALQDAAGNYHDWCILCARLRREIRRLEDGRTVHLAFQIGRLLAGADDHRKRTRKLILPETLGLQSHLSELSAAPLQTPAGAPGPEEAARPS